MLDHVPFLKKYSGEDTYPSHVPVTPKMVTPFLMLLATRVELQEREVSYVNEELITDKINTHERRINNHADRLDKLELHEAARDVKIDNLCEKLEKQTRSIYGMIGMVGTALVSFFFYAVQQGIFH